jgi:hypothetical protein
MTITRAIAILCSALLIAQRPYAFAQQAPPAAPPAQTNNLLTPQQLESLVAPIALYPDPILSQVLVASTYPLEIVEAGRWLAQNSSLKGQALADAAKKQTWDPSIQAMVLLPDVLKRLDQNVSWTSDLGNAFLAQQDDVMQAIQRMRRRASDSGALQTTPQQTVTTTTENGTNYIVIEPASPEVVYVPQYNPVAVWGPPPEYYPFPALYYPPVSTGAVIAASAISFGAGLAVGAIWGGGWGGWGWNPGWGRGNIYINQNFINNNRFNRINNIGNGNRWEHNPAHRGGVPYGNRDVANRFRGGGPQVGTRPTVGQTQQRLNQTTGQGAAGKQFGQRGGTGSANRIGQGGAAGAGAGRGGVGNMGQGGGAANRMNQGIGQRGGATGIPSQGNANRISPGNLGPGAGDRIGNRNIGGGGGQGMFGGMNQGAGRVHMNQNRGMGSFGGGFNRGGGGLNRGGGGFRGGGGRGGGRRR